MNPKVLKEILEGFRDNPRIGGIVRRPIALNTIDDALEVVEAIGKLRSPNFVIDNDNRWVYKQLVKWAVADPTMMAVDPTTNARIPGRLNAGIYISGPTGTGKSWAMEVLSLFTEIDKIMVGIGGDNVRLWWQGVRAEEIWEQATIRAEATSEFKNRRILCIQDLASEPTAEAVHMGARTEPLRQILEARGDRTDRLTLITSNFGIADAEISHRYTDRVVSRLREMCNFLVLPGRDRRGFA